MQAIKSGWRQATHAITTLHPVHTEDKASLFEANRLCCRVLNLPSSCRFVLDQLCASYGGQAIEGRIIVWPSNRWLEERTGISERTIRFAIRRLIEKGVILAKDSPNGKRYARRGTDGQVHTAYGFDLTPILSRVSEFRDDLVIIKERAQAIRRLYDELTITRRQVVSALQQLTSLLSDQELRELEVRAQRLSQLTPRRSRVTEPGSVLDEWKDLYQEVRNRMIAASAGEDCRHKDTNKYPPENSCYKDHEDLEIGCKDATEMFGNPKTPRELFDMADRARGAAGVSHDGWLKARASLGDIAAARLLYFVIQMQLSPAPGAEPIRNLGGYYRSMVRMVKSRRIDMKTELFRLTSRSLQLCHPESE